MKHSLGWTIGAALGMVFVVLFFAMVAAQMSHASHRPATTLTQR